MADKNTNSNGNADTQAEGAQTMQNLPLRVHAQYIRDVSFENPNAPETLKAGLEAPKMDIGFNMDARNVQDTDAKGIYEVALKVTVNATRDEKTVFIAEVEYGAVVELSQVPEEKHHPLLLIEVPRMMFPYVRQIMSDLTQNGGYPPLMLNPVDFGQIYMQRFAKQNTTTDKNTDTETKKSA